MKHVEYCLLGTQVFPLELVDNLVRIFPNCTLGQVYGKSGAISEDHTGIPIHNLTQGSRKCRRRWR